MAPSSRSTRPVASFDLSVALLLCACVVATLGEDQAISAPSLPASVSRSNHEFYDQPPWRGTLRFQPSAQELRLQLNTTEDVILKKGLGLAELREGWVATAFTQLGPGVLFFAGVDWKPRRVAGLRVVYDPVTWELRSVEAIFVTPEMDAPTGLDLFPDGRRLALLDRGTRTLWALDLEGGTLERLSTDPKLGSMKYVHTHSVGDAGVSVWATRLPEAFLNGTLMGPAVKLIDFDGDGVLELN